MNTKRSEEIISRYRRSSHKAVRRTTRLSRVLPGSPADVFTLLCPSKEGDWLPGWDAELIHTESGYAEPGCVFRTDGSGTAGPGVWVFTRHEEPLLVEIVRFTPEVLFQIRAALEEAGPDRTEIQWEYVLTGLTEGGNLQVEGMASTMEEKANGLGVALEHYLRTGTMISGGGHGPSH